VQEPRNNKYDLDRPHNKVKPTRYRVSRILSLARPYWWQLAIILLAASLTSIFTIAYPALTGQIIDSAIKRNVSALHSIIFLLLGLGIAQALISFVQNYWMTNIGEKIVIDLRVRLFSHLQSLPLSFFQENRTGELLSRLTNDVSLVRSAVTNNLISFIQSLITLLLGIAVIIGGPNTILAAAQKFNINVPLAPSNISFGPTLLITALILFPVAFLPIFASRSLRKFAKQELAKLSDATASSEEAISNAKIVKAFTREDYEIERYSALALQQFSIVKRRSRLQGLVQAGTGLISSAGIAAFLWYAGSAVLNGSLTIGILVTIVIYFGILSQPFLTLGTLYAQFQTALGAAERIFELLDQPVTITDEPGARPLPPVEGDVRFEQVQFGYDEHTTVLHDITFEAEQGKVVALVGPSGAGKTTIANLIPRFFDVQKGRITVDGYDIRNVQVKSLREQIGIVLQEPILFGATIRENIAYGRLDATQAEIEEVARAANAQEFITQLPDGYNTLVGERGVKLSGGQRQRIAIARALLRNPRILILDEATSSLDNESERLVQEALERLMRKRTTIVIAHRLTTVQNADKIVVIEKGRIIEQGKHEELLELRGTYYRLYTRKLHDEVEEAWS
jgi:ATP-binding cassette, subfamily B, bacterial MsbA